VGFGLGLVLVQWFHVICWSTAILVGVVISSAGSSDASFPYQCMYRYGKVRSGLLVLCVSTPARNRRHARTPKLPGTCMDRT